MNAVAGAESPKTRLLQWGREALSDSDLLCLLLGTDSVDKARQVEALGVKSGGLEKLSVADVCEVYGVGPSKVAVLMAGIELGRRQFFKSNRARPWRFSGSRQSFEFCREQLGGRSQEAFLIVAMDAKNRLIGSRVVSEGTLTQSLVHPREVFAPILSMRAAGFLLAHNHPSGDPTPSPEDTDVTRRFRACSEILALTFIDHIVVGKDRYFSYADTNWEGAR